MRGALTPQLALNLSFLESVKGTSKTISFSRLETCAPCSGKGVAKGSRMASCKTCRGSGQVRRLRLDTLMVQETRVRGSFYFSSTCRACRGSGQINPDPCSSCAGLGAVKRNATVQVDIPSGISEGEVFSVRREGNRMGGQNGDLLIQFAVEKSDVFTRKKNDIYLNVPVTLYQALVGGNVIVPTIHGSVEMKIPPGTQPDDVKKLSGRGVPNASSGELGHQYVKLKVAIPKSLTPHQEHLLAQCFDPDHQPAQPKAASPTDPPKPGHESLLNRWSSSWLKWLKWY